MHDPRKPPPTAAITRFEKIGPEPLSKIISLVNGEPVSDGSVCKMTRGNAQHIEIADLGDLVPILLNATSHQAITLGVIRSGERPPEGGTVRVVTKKRHEEMRLAPRDGTIARTKDFMCYEPGRPACLLFDFDLKGMPGPAQQRVRDAGGLWPLMVEVFPALKAAGTVARASTSAGLIGPDGRRFPGSGGLHIYLMVLDGTDIDRALKNIRDRLWLADLGWFNVSSAGSLLNRCVIDASVGGPERLVFEGAPSLRDGLTQDAEGRRPVHAPGAMLDTREAFPDLTPQEAAEIERRVKAARQAIKPEEERVKAAIVETEAAAIVRQKGVPIEKARATARERVRLRLEQQVLTPDTILQFDDIGAHTVAAVLADPERFIDETLADPVEGIAYGPGKAKVFRAHDGRGLLIHSFAHGGMNYRLVYDEDAIEAAINASGPKDVAERLAAMLVQSAYAAKSPEEDRLIAYAAKHAKCNKTPIKNTIKKARAEAGKAAAEAARERRAGDADGRPIIVAPRARAEVGATLAQIEGYLKVDATEPPMRGPSGRLVGVREREMPGSLHLLVSDSERAEKGDAAVMAAPRQPVLDELDEFGVASLVEKHVRLEHTDAYGHTSFVRLQSSFCNALNAFTGSTLPVAWGVQTMPLILPNRELLVTPGLHHKYKLVLRVDPVLAAAIPTHEFCTLVAGTEAFRFLVDEVLADVETTPEGKVVIVAIMLSVIERHLLDARPAFIITGAQAGAGKTTVGHLVSVTTTGKPAAAATWSENEEERRKVMLALALINPPFVMWDNIPRGAQISCPHLEKLLTSPTIEDRILGSSKMGVGLATGIHAFTGNRISAKGDFATRSISADILSSRPDPANRNFKHADILGWAQQNRLRILQALYTILLVARPDRNVQAETRYKTWWNLVGRPLEIVSGVRIGALFEQTVEDDETTEAVRAFYAAWWDSYGKNPVRAADVHAAVYEEFGAAGWRNPNPKRRLAEAFFPATGGHPKHHVRLDPREIGKRLKTLDGQVAAVGEAIVRLRVRPNQKDGNTYFLDVMSGVLPVPQQAGA